MGCKRLLSVIVANTISTRFRATVALCSLFEAVVKVSEQRRIVQFDQFTGVIIVVAVVWAYWTVTNCILPLRLPLVNNLPVYGSG